MTQEYLQKSDEVLSLNEESSMSLDEFVEKCKSNSKLCSHSVKYVLDAIEHCGKREILEDGEEKDRWKFFDDPYNDGEHAILGNTDILNDFVDGLRRMASEKGDNERIIWFEGPTASGKSELKRCLVNGIEGYSNTEEGARYTVEWSLDSLSSGGMTYGENSLDKNWYKSPVNIHPLSVFPEEVREEIISEIDDDSDNPTKVETSLDPFSNEAFESLKQEYNNFEDIVSSEHLRVSRIYPEVGDGIGSLHSEDLGEPKQRLVGSWMKGAMESHQSRGRKNAQAFSYDGVLSQGNGIMSIIEDSSHHSDVLDKLMNVCEEKMVKLDNRISMDIDTLIVAISNPDLTEELEQYDDAGQSDPFRALRRRMDKYKFRYLTTLSIEAMLIRRLLTGSNELWDGEDERMERVAEPIEIYGSEIAPRTIQAVSMFEVCTRLEVGDVDSVPTIDKALVYEQGEAELEGDNLTINNIKSKENRGRYGIPVTFTVDVLVTLAQDNDIVYPSDALSGMIRKMNNGSIFNANESSDYTNIGFEIKNYVIPEQESDVLDAMVGDIEVSEEDIREYIDSLTSWQDEEEEGYDAYELREFETRYLGQDEDNYNEHAEGNEEIASFRRSIIIPINRYLWNNRDENFNLSEISLSEIPELSTLIDKNDWDMVNRVFPDAKLTKQNWIEPLEDTQTKELKEKTIRRMQENMGYSEESAENVSTKVIVESAPSEKDDKFAAEVKEVNDGS